MKTAKEQAAIRAGDYICDAMEQLQLHIRDDDSEQQKLFVRVSRPLRAALAEVTAILESTEE